MQKISLVTRRKKVTNGPSASPAREPSPPRKLARDWFDEGCKYDSSKEADKAIEAYRQAIRLDEKMTDAHVNLGFIFLDRTEYEEAVRCFGKVVELESANPEAYNNLGYVYEKALEVGKNDVEALINLAHIADLQGNYQAAVERYERAIEADTDAVAPHFCIALLYDKYDMFDEATEHYQAVIRLDRNHVKALFNLGTLHTKQGKYRKGVECFQRVLEVAGDNADVYNNLGAIYEELGRFNDAMAMFEKALSINPRHEEAQYNLARMEYDRHVAHSGVYTRDLAIRQIRTILAMNPKNLKVRQLLEKVLA